MNCPVCGGEMAALGQLGSTMHFRCRNCGADSSAPADEVETPDDEGNEES